MIVQNGQEQQPAQNSTEQQQQQQPLQQSPHLPQQQQYQAYHPSLANSPSSKGLNVPDTHDARPIDETSSQGQSSLSSSVEDRNPFRQLKNKPSGTPFIGNENLAPSNDKNERPLSIFNPTPSEFPQETNTSDPSLPAQPIPPPPPSNITTATSTTPQYFPDPVVQQKMSQMSISSHNTAGSSVAPVEMPASSYSTQSSGMFHHSPHQTTASSAFSGSPSSNTNPFRDASNKGKTAFYEEQDDELLPGLPAKSMSPNTIPPHIVSDSLADPTPPLPPKTTPSPAPAERVYTPDSTASEEAARAAADTTAGKQKEKAPSEDTGSGDTGTSQSADTSNAPPPEIPKETYLIKHIRYLEPVSRKLKKGSILLQNENGPCPLIALVNVLSLSRECLVLTEALRVRERLSLELLLQVVCEELVLAGNWTGDLTELWKFLLDLRKGMNVNPQFVGDEIKAEEFLQSQNVASGRPLPNPRPGAFVQTRELKLYNAFQVPLVHGWLPSPTSPFFPVLVTHARDFEKAQDLIIQQQFIIEKHSHPDAEQMSTEDSEIISRAMEVQEFLDASGTQLTSYGINVLGMALKPGEYCIFFRNDHFSTLHKHAVSGELFTLVTDAGYASYEEIVWESLVDGTGRGGSHFSGDFRPVGHEGSEIRAQEQALNRRQNVETTSAEDDWKVVQNKRHAHRMQHNNNNSGNNGNSSSIDERVSGGGPALPPRRSSAQTSTIVPADGEDTTDFDLALAIHLQQEEDERANRAARSADTSNYHSMVDIGGSGGGGGRGRGGGGGGFGGGGGRGGGSGGGGGGGSGVPITGHRRPGSTGYRPPQPPRTAASARDAANAQPRVPTGDPSIDDPPPRYERVDSNLSPGGPSGPGGPVNPLQQPPGGISGGYPGNQWGSGQSAGTHQSGQSAYAQMSGHPAQAQGQRRRTSQAGYDDPHGQGKEKCAVM